MSPRVAYTEKEIELLARLIRSEAVGEGEIGMLLVGNVVVNRVVATCDVFDLTPTITDAIYQLNAFAGINTPLFYQGANAKELELAKKAIFNYRRDPAYYALWFKNPGTNVTCPPEFFGTLAGRYKKHCFYDSKDDLNCKL